jgi:DNA-binding FadR family transcriptional regulator
MSASTLHAAVLDALGSDIVSGEFPAGSVHMLAELQQRYAVSRGVARECMRILESARMATSQRRTGTATPEQHWKVNDARVIRWRLDSKHRARQLRSLTEVRLGIEPMAAHLVPLRATADQRDALPAAAAQMRRTARRTGRCATSRPTSSSTASCSPH